MDDSQTPISTWLAFSLAFDASARLCQTIRQSQPCCQKLGQLIHSFLHEQNDELLSVLNRDISPAELLRLRSRHFDGKIEQALRWCQSSEHNHLLGLDDPGYPPLLRDTADPPPLLYAKGSLNALNLPKIAFVGSRKASTTAISHTRSMASTLAEKGIAIVSGLAIGIDAAAHQGALDARGVTIAVAATEPESVYPKRHRVLEQRIVESNGLIVTEYPLGSPTLRWYFPRRNRIISGLSSGVLVAEAALPSGTLTTANHAMNQGREVMAVPGSVRNSQARGCHSLIKQGAALVEDANDMLDALGPEFHRLLDKQQSIEFKKPDTINRTVLTNQHDREQFAVNSDKEMEILGILAVEPANIDELMTRLQLSVSELSSLLGLLEIKGKITSLSNGRYTHC